MQIGIAIGEEADLELLDQLAHLLFVDQQRGNRHQRGVILWDALAEVELRQRLRLEERGDDVVDQVDRALGHRKNSNRNATVRPPKRDSSESAAR